MAWLVWHNRNELWLGRPAGKAEDIGLQASQYVLEFIEQQTALKVPDHQRLVKWSRPPIGKIKVNVAEKVFSAHQMGVGVVIRDADGEVLVALSEKFNEGGDGLWRITRAMWSAILLCWEMGFHSALVECTNASLLALLQSHDTCYTEQNGSKTLTDLIVSNADQGRPFNCLIHALLLPWVADVAREHHLPSALLWIQPAMVLDIYYYYFNGFANVISEDTKDPSCLIQLPGLPLLTSRDLPSFLLASNTYSFALPTFQAEFEALEKDTHPRVLVNTFDALEPEALKAIKKFNLVGVGPLIPSAFLDGKDPSDKSFGGDLIKASKDHCYIEWLNSKAESIGCLCFVWELIGKEEKEMEKFSCREELEEKGMIVSWCSQVEVLSHPSVGCFVTHCGWNSSLESLVSGVPVVGFPQWSDQGTNAKLIQDVWKTGVRVEVNKDGIVEGDEIKRCLELVMGDGERGEEMRRNAKKWKELAREAAKEGGSSYNNLKDFVDEIGEGNCCLNSVDLEVHG
uniref:Glycosyltransferase n=1 Tax=Fagus sylvatica TaxID=28930 RepID=A0A2N9EKZ7_FAGSY